MLDNKLSIHFLRNIAIDPISNCLKKIGLDDNINYDITFSNYRELDDGLFNLNRNPNKNDLNYVFGFMWLDYSKFENTDNLSEYLNKIIELTKSINAQRIFLNTLIPYAPAQGLQSTRDDLNKIYEGNKILLDLSQSNSALRLVDLNNIIKEQGTINIYDTRFWYLYNQPFTSLFYKELSKTIHSCRNLDGIRKIKVIVLDCDNTLWGGIVGEEGFNNIRVGNGTFPGNIYADFQSQLKELNNAGILLAICSKNNELDVTDAFNQNKNFILKYDDFVTTRINWHDKVANILSISKELNLGLDSFLFVDDSPFEIENVREHLPEVNTFQIPNNRFELCKYFDNFISQFDLDLTQKNDFRLESYKAERIREEVKGNYTNNNDYLNSLQMKIEISKINDRDITRCAELIQRTNQFNSTGEKLNLSDFKSRLEGDSYDYFTLRASDKFGDYGLVGLASTRKNTECGEIDTFLLSCRILGRQVEKVFLSAITEVYIPQRFTEIKFRYLENNKNIQVLDFLNDLGFEQEGINFFRSNRSKLKNMLEYPQSYNIEIRS